MKDQNEEVISYGMLLSYSVSFSLIIAFFSSLLCLGYRRPDMDVTLSKNSVSVSKNYNSSLVICFIKFCSSSAVTSGRFSLKGRETFLPFDLSGMASTLQYQRTL